MNQTKPVEFIHFFVISRHFFFYESSYSKDFFSDWELPEATLLHLSVELLLTDAQHICFLNFVLFFLSFSLTCLTHDTDCLCWSAGFS